MSSFNESACTDGNNDGPSSFSSTVSPGVTPRQPIGRRESRNTSNWPDASPLYHNEGTSYFQQGRVSPTLSRRMQNASSTPGVPINYQLPSGSAPRRHSRSQHRSSSVSSVPQRRRDAVVSEEEEDEDEPRTAYDGRKTPTVNLDDASGSDDEEAERARAADTASEAGSLDPVTLYGHSSPSIISGLLMPHLVQEGTPIINQRRASIRSAHLETRALQEVQDCHSRRRTRASF